MVKECPSVSLSPGELVMVTVTCPVVVVVAAAAVAATVVVVVAAADCDDGSR